MDLSLQQRIHAFTALGNLLQSLPSSTQEDLFPQIVGNNPWFIPAQTQLAIQGIREMLRPDSLENWLANYPIPPTIDQKSIGLVMAGNIPGVGFHDLLCVLLTGHIAHIKLSSTDRVLIPWLVDRLLEIEPGFSEQIRWAERLQGMDAYIATGSNNSARYFDYYFGKYPHIIRKNRTSVAVLNGKETAEELVLLTSDVLQYFGLGCRNVSKLYVSSPQQIVAFLEASSPMSHVMDHHKYANNYDYNKSIYLVNGEDHLDNGFLLMRQSEDLVSPIAVVHYAMYHSQEEVEEKLRNQSDRIQCTLSKGGWLPGSIPFGSAQCPVVSDYADNVDTIQFLLSL
ncbi:hypothetical protein ADIS_3212 [Lunatimonas lonarensis]|uniref:Acyl-CoA reductase n=1 Tax=Lunatimonas lonarensis TaxID=1232681 RepID=R7ZQ09_9BACT|nr:acyl-CoA reductase [Lunatimonas lonarensis]EON76084.1 hypothetical protein ADIS_3212 [Lunatimonas lonarensis]